MKLLLTKLHCWISGHPVPGKHGEFIMPIRQARPNVDLPYFTAACPRCGTELRLPFLPGTRGMDTPAHHLATLRWQEERGQK